MRPRFFNQLKNKNWSNWYVVSVFVPYTWRSLFGIAKLIETRVNSLKENRLSIRNNQKLVKTQKTSRIINTLPARDKEATCLKNKWMMMLVSSILLANTLLRIRKSSWMCCKRNWEMSAAFTRGCVKLLIS